MDASATADSVARRIYAPVDSTQHEIRLLRIQPLAEDSSNFNLLECFLDKVSLHDNPVFDALSYTWGDEGDVEAIGLNGQPFYIRRNLFNALSTLRNANVISRYLWADAVCINLNDVNERHHQVQLMGSIYSQAQTVRIWLGTEERGLSTFFRKVQSGAGAQDLLSMQDGCIDGFMSVIERPWWKRLWIVQEVLLASNAVVHCGTLMIPWQVLYGAIHCLADAYLDRQLDPTYLDKLNTRSLTLLLHGAYIFDTTREKERKDSADPRSIVDIIAKFASCDVGDPRDRVYGTLGLLPSELNIQADYQSSIASVYRNCTMHVVKWSQSLEILRLCKQEAETSNWPSWVPDFRSLTSGFNPRFKASGQATCYFLERSVDQLVVHALFIAEIERVGEPNTLKGREDNSRPTTSWSYKELCQQWRQLATNTTSSANIRDKCNMPFWHTLGTQSTVTKARLGALPASTEAVALEAELNDWLLGDGEACSGKAQALAWQAQSYSAGKTVSITQDGRMVTSLVKPNARDCIAIIAGCREPFVLRHQPDRGKDMFKIVCSCYSEGIMFGECIYKALEHITKHTTSVSSEGALGNFIQHIRHLHRSPSSIVAMDDDAITVALTLKKAVLQKTDLEFVDSATPVLEFLVYLSGRMSRWEAHDIGAAEYAKLFIPNEEGKTEIHAMIAAFVFAQTVAIEASPNTGQDLAIDDRELDHEVVASLVLTTGLIIFEALLSLERVAFGRSEEEYTSYLSTINHIFEAILGSGRDGAAPLEWYNALKDLAHEEVAIERQCDSAFKEITLV